MPQTLTNERQLLYAGEPFHQLPVEGKRHLRDSGGTPTPFGFASSLRRETRLQDWTHQSPALASPSMALRATLREQRWLRNAVAPLPQHWFTTALPPND
ncbi:MAG: hypothetical protein F6K28_56475 [Microcoleus sp. SIO2G3]|nr:hypothetical protein [Microcoleus sp. SIO2G3]